MNEPYHPGFGKRKCRLAPFRKVPRPVAPIDVPTRLVRGRTRARGWSVTRSCSTDFIMSRPARLPANRPEDSSIEPSRRGLVKAPMGSVIPAVASCKDANPESSHEPSVQPMKAGAGCSQETHLGHYGLWTRSYHFQADGTERRALRPVPHL